MNNPVDDAIAIWTAGVAAVEPGYLTTCWMDELIDLPMPMRNIWKEAERIIIVGGGKAGGLMAEAVENSLATNSSKIVGCVNVPFGSKGTTRMIELNVARPAGSNFPTEAGVIGSNSMLKLISSANHKDVAIVLISGGASALLPAPVAGVSLKDKLDVTKLLHYSGATIDEMNCVRKHLSLIKGGQLAQSFRGQALFAAVISDVLGNALDVIGSGPTVPDPTTFADAYNVLQRHRIIDQTPISVRDYIRSGMLSQVSETPKINNPRATTNLIGTNDLAVQAAKKHVMDYHSYKVFETVLSGDTLISATSIARKLPSLNHRQAALLFGGETTVILGDNPGKGGRNQEFVLAMLCELGIDGMNGVTILCAGTDGEDGPTDAAGAIGTVDVLLKAKELNLDPHDYLRRHDAYHFFERCGGLLKTGLTGTNVMDLGVILRN